MTTWQPQIIGDGYDLVVIQWGAATNGAKFGDQFVPVARGDIVDRSIQVSGTFGSGTTINIQGSNEAINATSGTYANLHDPFSNVIAIQSAVIAQVVEVSAWMKPAISAGDGTENLLITVCSRRSFR